MPLWEAHGCGKRPRNAPRIARSPGPLLSPRRPSRRRPPTLQLPRKPRSTSPPPTSSLVSNWQPRNMAAAKTVFLFDVDNTLLNNDRVTADLKRHLDTEVGQDRAQRYWEFFENIRSELGYADYLGALQRYRIECPRDPRLLA